MARLRDPVAEDNPAETAFVKILQGGRITRIIGALLQIPGRSFQLPDCPRSIDPLAKQHIIDGTNDVCKGIRKLKIWCQILAERSNPIESLAHPCSIIRQRIVINGV